MAGAADSTAAASSLGPWLFACVALVLVAAGAWWIGDQGARRRAAAERRLDQRLLRSMQQLADGLCWRTDVRGCVTDITLTEPVPQWAVTAVPAGSWVGRPLAELLAVTPVSSAPVGTAGGVDGDGGLAGALAAQSALRGRRVMLRQPGATQPLELSAVPQTDDLGAFTGHVGILRLAPVAPKLLDAAADDAAAQDALSFSYTVSHDLRAPIRVVEGFTRILKEDYGAQIDRVGNDHLDRVLGAAARMNQMIDALLAIARLSTQPLARQPVSLSQLAGFVVDELRRGAPERQIDIQVQPDISAHGDPTLLRLVLENLLGNAWKYTQRCHAPRVSFGCEAIDGQRVFVVRDNGAGFDMRAVDRLFGLFQRLHSASEFPGTGVGLASVKRIVARHGGRIWADAEPGKGASFYFTLRD
jgi:signal transduction histidine kinase